LAGLAGLATNVLAQVVVFRLWRVPRLLASVFLGFGLGGFTTLGLSMVAALHMALSPVDLAGRLLANLLLYAALGYCYFHFINLGETARRVRLLWELVDAGGALPAPELLRRYNASHIVENRLGRLLRHGQISFCQGRYRIGRPAVLWMARLLDAWKGVLLGRKMPAGTP
jgi:hypothetical protein